MTEISSEVPSKNGIESPKSLQDQVIEETLTRAAEIMRSEDPQVAKARSEVASQKKEWKYWLDTEKISQEDYDRIENAALIEARTNVVFDGLTGLLNRNGLNLRLDDFISRSSRTHEPLSLLYLDLEGFKAVNDTLGHDEGDRILIKTADFLRQTVRAIDAVARVGGDEYVIALLESRTANRKQANGERKETAQERVAREIQENYAAYIQDSYQLDGAQTWPHIGVRIGMATYSQGESKQDFIARGDEDMNSKRDSDKPSR